MEKSKSPKTKHHGADFSTEPNHPLGSEVLAERMELLAGFLVEVRGQGLTLSSDETQMIKAWVMSESDFGQLLAIVDEIASLYFAQKTPSGRGRSISGLDKRVQKAIEERR
jgi:hypothetical protein